MNIALTAQGQLRGLIAIAFLCGAVAGGAAALAQTGDADLAALKEKFRRPAAIPFPASNPYSPEKRALGERLFHDKRLSADGSFACATCHDRAKGFSDGRVTAVGVPRRALARHTPTLWNLAWAGPVFWDGRARSLEEQVAGPIIAPDEMAQPMAPLIARLATNRDYARAFAKAFPKDPRVSEDNLKKAIATYERTLVSPQTRFDRWVEGDKAALSAQETEGFRLFTGKAGCANCHSGWAFTDYAFYDVGLESEDRGRGAVLRLEQAEHAFKTPSLREVGRRAPYMHDGSLATLADAVRHYVDGITDRPTLPPDLRKITLSADEQAALVAFLRHADQRGRSEAAGDHRRRNVERRSGRTRHVDLAARQDLHADACGASGAARGCGSSTTTRAPTMCASSIRQARFRFRRAGAGRDRRDRVSEGRLLPGVLRHPSQDGAQRRRHPIATRSSAVGKAVPYFRRIFRRPPHVAASS